MNPFFQAKGSRKLTKCRTPEAIRKAFADVEITRTLQNRRKREQADNEDFLSFWESKPGHYDFSNLLINMPLIRTANTNEESHMVKKELMEEDIQIEIDDSMTADNVENDDVPNYSNDLFSDSIGNQHEINPKIKKRSIDCRTPECIREIFADFENTHTPQNNPNPGNDDDLNENESFLAIFDRKPENNLFPNKPLIRGERPPAETNVVKEELMEAVTQSEIEETMALCCLENLDTPDNIDDQLQLNGEVTTKPEGKCTWIVNFCGVANCKIEVIESGKGTRMEVTVIDFETYKKLRNEIKTNHNNQNIAGAINTIDPNDAKHLQGMEQIEENFLKVVIKFEDNLICQQVNSSDFQQEAAMEIEGEKSVFMSENEMQIMPIVCEENDIEAIEQILPKKRRRISSSDELLNICDSL